MSIFDTAKRVLGRLPHVEPVVLALLLLGTLSTMAFIKIADEVLLGRTQNFDQWALKILRNPQNAADPIGPRWVKEMGRDATALGGMAWLTFTTVIVAGYLAISRKFQMLMFTVGAISSGAVVSLGLKTLFDRPRPDLVPYLSQIYSSSFPSAHSMLAAVVYLTLGSLLAAVTPDRILKAYIMFVAVMLTIFVGLSRVYLGVHYPTDVLAGWLAGLIWALACWFIARWLQSRGRVEGSGWNEDAGNHQ